MSIRLLLTGLGLLAVGVLAAEAPSVDPATGLKVAPGWETVRAHCGGCHSHALVTAQRADRNTWRDIIGWMQETQNLWQFDAATEKTILDYLVTNYPPHAQRRRAPLPPGLLPRQAKSADSE